MVSKMRRINFNFCHHESNGAASYPKSSCLQILCWTRVTAVGTRLMEVPDGNAFFAKLGDQIQKVAGV